MYICTEILKQVHRMAVHRAITLQHLTPISGHRVLRAMSGVRLLGERGVEHHPEEDHHGQAEVEREGELGEQRGPALRLSRPICQVESGAVQDKLVQAVCEGGEGELLLHPLASVHPDKFEVNVTTVHFSHCDRKLFRITFAQPT